MDHLKVYVLCLCFVLSLATLHGPDSSKKTEETSDDYEKAVENLETDTPSETEYYNEISEAFKKQIISMQEYAYAVSKGDETLKKDEEKKGKQCLVLK